MDGSEYDSDEDNVGRVSKDVNRVAGNSPKSRTADVLLTALNGGDDSPMKANLLIDWHTQDPAHRGAMGKAMTERSE